MLKNYFKTAWRNLWRNKFYSTINIVGLAIGLAVGIMILLWVQDEYSYDSFHSNANRIYKINSHIGTGSSAQVWQNAPAPLAVFSSQIPDIEKSVRVNDIEEEVLMKSNDKKFIESKLAFVDSNFFSFFSFPLLQGNKAKPFNNINSIVISASEAKKNFGNTNAIGKVLSTLTYGDFTVSGVMQDFPHNSNLQYDMLLPMNLYAQLFIEQGGNGVWKTMDEDLGSYASKIFFQLRPHASIQNIENKLAQAYRDKKGDMGKGNLFTLQPIQTLHLIAPDGNRSALQMVRIFLVIAVLILIIACINYVNLSTARSLVRAKEVSIRKIIGAEKYQLFIQFIIESTVLFFVASLLAVGIIQLLLPLYNSVSGKQLLFSIGDGNVWLVIGAAIVGTLLLASVYPALLLSSFKPLLALKGQLSAGYSATSFRKALVVTQFIFSVVLIIGTLVIAKQLHYIRQKDLGYNKEQVFTFKLSNEAIKQYDAIRNDLSKQNNIVAVTTATDNIVGIHNTTGDANWDGKDQNSVFIVHAAYIDENFVPFFKIKLATGSNFESWPSDSAHFILNETAVKKAGIENPIGKRFRMWQANGTIVGVVKDFNYASLKQSVEPMIFLYNPFNWQIFIRTTGKDASKAIAATQKIWKEYDKNTPFQYSFLDDDYSNLYQSDEKAGILINAFTAVAIFISCLGLFGLVTFMAQVKTKEIGIRKVLGASVANITSLLSKEFIKLICLAFLIASPVAWWAMNQWLQDFAYRINITAWIFILAGFIVLLMTVITISFQSIKAALANPVKGLRSE